MTSRRVQSRPLEVLLAEDNPADVRLTELALEQTEFHVNLTVAEDGEEAMAILRKEGQFAQLSRPDLVLLDLNLPKKDGREVLAELKADADLAKIPVVVLTTSRRESDMRYVYGLNASSYIAKPVDLVEFDKMIRDLLNYWINVTSLPTGPE